MSLVSSRRLLFRFSFRFKFKFRYMVLLSLVSSMRVLCVCMSVCVCALEESSNPFFFILIVLKPGNRDRLALEESLQLGSPLFSHVI